MAKEVNKRINVYINGKEVENNVKSIRAAISKLTNELNKMEIGSKEYIETSKKIKDLKAIYDQHTKSLKATRMDITAISTAYMAATRAMRGFVNGVQEYIDAWTTIDDALSAVQKTTGMTREEVEALDDALKGIDTRTSEQELLKIAEIGGRMGLAKDQIESFTKSVDMANVALGDTFAGGAEEISAVLGKISLAFKETRENDIGDSISRVGSAINEVGASANATEPNIASFVQRVGSMPEALRPSVQEAVALGAAFEESSIDAEIASRAYGILMQKATVNVDKFASVMGRSVEEVEKLVNTDPTKFFVEFSKALQGMSATEMGGTLKELGLNANGVIRIVGAMSGSYERFNEILETSNTAFRENVSLMNEFNTVNNNTAAQLEKAKNNLQAVRAEIGKQLIPVMIKLTEGSAGALRILSEWITFAAKHRALVISLTAAWAAYYAIKSKAFLLDKAKNALLVTTNALMGAYKTVVLAVTAAYNTMTGATTRAAAAQRLLKSTMASTPWGALLLAITAAAAGLAKLVSSQRSAAQAADAFGVAVGKEQAEVDRLFNELKNAEKGTSDYSDALNALSEKYPDIIQQHIDEEGALRDIEQAYNDIVTSIQAKTAAQLKSDEISRATEDGIKDMVKSMRGFNDEQRETIKRMAEAGKTAEQIGSEIGISYYFTDFQGNRVKDDRFQELTNYVAAYSKMRKDIAAIDKKYDPYIYSGSSSSGSTETGGGDSGSGSGGGGEDSLIKKQRAFEEKLAEFRRRQQRETMDGWAKTKQAIVDSYQEMIDEATGLGLKSTAEALGSEMNDTIVAAGEKYLKDGAKKIQNAVDEAAESITDNKGSKIIEAVAGSNKQWADRLKVVRDNINELTDILADDSITGEERKIFEEALENANSAYVEITSKQAQATLDIISEYTKGEAQFVEEKNKQIARSQMSEHDRRVAEIEEEYDLRIEAVQKEIAAMEILAAAEGADGDAIRGKIEDLRKLVSDLETLKGDEVSSVGRSTASSNVWDRLVNFDWSNIEKNWKEGLKTMTDALQEFASAATDIFSSINEIRSNNEEAELNRFQDACDKRKTALEQQLSDGVISQKFYDAQVSKIEKDREAREKKIQHDQFERNKRSSIVQATIAGALAIVQAIAQLGPVAGAIAGALMAATTAAQIAVIASQVNPYAMGGYVDREQIALIGEDGPEWVASNRLVTDRRTAPVISALQSYQEGDSRALSALRLSSPDWRNVSQSGRAISDTFAGRNGDGNEILKELKTMNKWLSDPKNRQAYISRKTQLEFDSREGALKEMARL